MSSPIYLKMSKTLKKLQLKAEYLLIEYTETEELFVDYSKTFNEEFADEHAFLSSKNPAESPIIKLDDSEEVEDESSVMVSDDLQKIYRLIAKKTHPDVCKVEEHKRFFSEAAAAYSKGDWISLISISNELSIPIPSLSKESIELINKSSQKWFKEIETIKNRLPWVWVTLKEKDPLLRSKIRMCMGIDEQEFHKWLETRNSLG